MRLIAFILTLLLALSPALSHAASNDDLFPPKVVVKGDNFTLTDREIEQAFIQFKQTSAARGQEIPPAQEPALMLSIREKLIAEKILFLSANEEDRKNGREAVDKYLKTVKDNSGSDESYKRQLKSLGMPAEEFERRMFEKAVGDMVLKREIKDKIKITDEQVKDYYQKNSDAFKSPVEITAAHILITTIDLKTRRPFPQEERLKRKAVARRLMERARSGEDFTKLVKEFSDDPGSKDKGGEYTFGLGQMVPQFEAAALSMEPGQISDVVETAYGYHIIKLIEKKGGEPVTLEDVKEQIRVNLEFNEFEKQLPGYLGKIREEAGVAIVD